MTYQENRNKGGRPKAVKGKARTKTISTRLTLAEWKAVMKRITDAGKKPSHFLRDLLLYGKVVSARTQEDRQQIRMLEGGCNNLNQLAKMAHQQGDLSENAEYDAAKDEQRDIETQIAELEEILKNAEVVQDNNTDKDAIKMESVVKLHDVEYDEDIEYVIVGSSEADSLNNKISNESPLGAAMLGKKVGDTVKVEAPAGVIEYKIISVQND